MLAFRTFWKILWKNKFTVFIYAIFLIGFGAFNANANNQTFDFASVKPSVAIINHDGENPSTKNLHDFFEQNSNLKNLEEPKIDDAIFYHDLSFAIFIPENYHADFLAGKNPAIEFKSNGNHNAAFAEMLLQKYQKFAQKLQTNFASDEEKIFENLNSILSHEIAIELSAKVDASQFSRATNFYNFANYSILGCLIYIICLILASFKSANIKKRMLASATSLSKINRELIFAGITFAFTLWFFYIALSFLIIGNVMLSAHGIIYILNSFIFTICATTIAFLIGNLVTNKNAANGIVNIVALGSSFLCGAFVPMSMLPENILSFAHILPSFYYIENNELIGKLETINSETLRPVLFNFLVMLGFSIFFVILTNIIARKRPKQN